MSADRPAVGHLMHALDAVQSSEGLVPVVCAVRSDAAAAAVDEFVEDYAAQDH